MKLIVSKAIIFGAGKWGSLAKLYYEDRCEIVCYVDNDVKLWNTYKDGIPVLSPEILRVNQDKLIIIANKLYADDIKRQLVESYNVSKMVLFGIDVVEKPLYYSYDMLDYDVSNEHIISFMGGLGNQMFQYSMLKYLQNQDKKASADFSWYMIPGRQFHEVMLWDVFHEISIPFSHPDKVCEYRHNCNVYIEPFELRGEKKYVNDVLECSKGIFEGYFQVASVAESVSDLLRREFRFCIDDELRQKKSILDDKRCVSVHIRRGDYLNSEHKSLNVCSKEYYRQPFSY